MFGFEMSQATTTFAYGTQQQASALISTLAAGQSVAGASTSAYQPTAPQTASTSLNSTNAVAYQQQNAAYQSMLEAHQRQQQAAIGGLQQAAYTSRPIQYQQQQQPDSSSAYSTAAVTASPAAANAVDTAMASYQQQLAAYQQQQQAFYQQQQQQQQQMASLQQQQSAAQVAQQNSLTTSTRSLQAGFAGHSQQQSPQGQYPTQQQTDQYMFTQPPPSAGASISSTAAVQQPPQQTSFPNNNDYYSQQMYSTPQPALQSNQHHMQANVAQNMYQDPSNFHSSSIRGGSHFGRPPAPYNENYMQHNPPRYNSFANSGRGSMHSGYNSGQQIRSQGFGHRMSYDSKNQRGGFTPRGTMNFSNRPFLSFYDGDENDPVPNVIYISELPNTITNELLAQQFSSAGPLATLDEQGLRSKVWIYKDKMTRAPRGDATITFQNAESAKKAISMFNGKEMFGKSIKVKQCTKKEMNNQIQIRLQIAQNPKNQGNYSSFDINNGVSTGGAGGPPPFTSFNSLRSTGANSPRGRGGYSRGGGYGQGGESFSDSTGSNRGDESNESFRGENTSTGPMRQNQRFDSSRRVEFWKTTSTTLSEKYTTINIAVNVSSFLLPFSSSAFQSGTTGLTCSSIPYTDKKVIDVILKAIPALHINSNSLNEASSQTLFKHKVKVRWTNNEISIESEEADFGTSLTDEIRSIILQI
ncbi:hypothetical protein GJ496_003378 [Pomphorhynchus laevis]|nr:hypothetical protein GJ496_003378 [Pomphorhynchus laevis]